MRVRNVLEYLEQARERFGEKVAFADVEGACTYAELEERAKRIGSALAVILEPGKPVPVFMEKGVDAICLFMGIVYAGCFYVLLDTKQPKGRLEQILETLDAEVLVTSKSYGREREGLCFGKRILELEELEKEEIEEAVLGRIREQALDIDPLYGIFTSGSTGVPKGVVVSHRSVIDFIEYFTDLFGICSEDVIGNQAPWDFDVSVKDIYSTLKCGATMQIIPKQYFSFPMKLLDFLCEREVTTLIWAVSALCIITTLKGFDYKIPKKVNKVMFSGEVMPVKHLNLWRQALPDALYVNLYGPTEITCNCTYYIVDRDFQPGEMLPIGQTFPNEKVFLLDEENGLVTEPGKMGEICVSGTALALGYYHNKEQTRKAFVQNPLNPWYMELIYRTGDLGSYNDRMELCFSTRKDFQIKHMGHRIELGEIESAIEKMEQVNRTCCIYDSKAGKILAFYEGAVERRQLQKKLREFLPAFMLPNRYIPVDRLPLTKNGKIDRKRLLQEYGMEA